MSSKQKVEASKLVRKPMKKFGDIEVHNDSPQIHKPRVIRKSKKNEKK